MPTALELGRELEKQRGELDSFIKSHSTAQGLDFSIDNLVEFNKRNERLGKMHDSWVKCVDAERCAVANGEALKSLQTVNRAPLFATQTGGDGGYGWQGVRGAVKSVGTQFVESAAYKSNAGDARAEFGVDVQDVSIKTTLTTAGALPYPMQQPGAVQFATRRPVVADLIPQTDTDQPAIVYLEQTTQGFGADTVAEGALKPETSLGWTRRTLPFEVIAHFIKITNQTLEDIPGIRDIIDQQMLLGLMLAEEDQILNGSGAAPDLQGFIGKDGVQTLAADDTDQFTAVMQAQTKIRYTGRANVTGGIMNPNDVQDIVTLKDTTGRFIYGNPTEAITNFRLWGVPTIITDAIAENTALYGDFVMYSRLWRKGGVRVLVGLEGDDLKRNIQTLVVEERATLEIDRPSAFCVVSGL